MSGIFFLSRNANLIFIKQKILKIKREECFVLFIIYK